MARAIACIGVYFNYVPIMLRSRLMHDSYASRKPKASRILSKCAKVKGEGIEMYCTPKNYNNIQN